MEEEDIGWFGGEGFWREGFEEEGDWVGFEGGGGWDRGFWREVKIFKAWPLEMPIYSSYFCLISEYAVSYIEGSQMNLCHY